MEEFDTILDKVRSELDMLENKGAIALPHYFQELGIKAVPGDPEACVIARYLEDKIGDIKPFVSPDCDNFKVFDDKLYIEVELDRGSELSTFASNFDSGHYPELDQDRSIIHD